MILCMVEDDPVSLEALTFASRLGDVEALVFGNVDVGGYVSHTRRVVHDRLDEYAPEAWAQAIVELEAEVVVDETEDHDDATRPSSRNSWATSVPPLRICTCVSCSGGTTSLTVSSALARRCGSIRSIGVFFARSRPCSEA